MDILKESGGTLYPNITKPLYLQLKDILVNMIETGALEPGDELPGERVLAELYDVSRVTVRKCIGGMVDEGLLIRSHGKETRVAQRRVSHRLGVLMGIVEELANTEGVVMGVTVLKHEFVPATPTVRRHLKLPENSTLPVYSFSRVLSKNNKPLAVNHSFVPYDIGKMVDALDLTRDKVFAHLESCGYNLSYGEQEIASGICNKEEAEVLRYQAGQPVLVIKRTTYLENGYPILYEKTIYRGDDYQYSIRLQRRL